jgi:hypothetical protein
VDKVKKETLEELMKKDDKDALVEENKPDAIALDEPKRRTWLIVVLTVLATLLIAGGAYVAYQSYKADKQLSNDNKVVNSVTQNQGQSSGVATGTQQIVYVNAAEGLNLRTAADPASVVLKVIPFGTKLTVLDTQGDWYKVEYDSAAGWCAKLYTTTEDPLVYKNTDYSFELTFPATWNTYTVVKRSTVDAGATAYYDVSLSTTDTTTYPSGVVSMFVIAVYTPSQWTAINTGSASKPTLIKETSDYVFAYSLGQAAPTDLASMSDDISSVVATFQQL